MQKIKAWFRVKTIAAAAYTSELNFRNQDKSHHKPKHDQWKPQANQGCCERNILGFGDRDHGLHSFPNQVCLLFLMH